MKINDINTVRMLEMTFRGDDRGNLVAVESGRDIPFEIKRIFYMYGTDKDVVRGQHANRKSAFVMINVSGKSTIRIKDVYGNEAEYILDKPNKALYIPEMIWKDMYDFSENSVLLVLSNEHYDATEYIRDYNEFIKEKQR